jgi:multidrug efflux system outer membrane protein
MSKPRLSLLLPLLLLLAEGCMVGPKYTVDQPLADTAYVAAPLNNDTAALMKWAALYDDPALVQLIRVTLDSNRGLWQAAARVEEARLQAGAVRTNLYPGIGYGLTAGGGSAGMDARRIGSGVDGGFFEALGRINWEIDIWGRLRHANRQAMAVYLEQEHIRNALHVSLVAEVAGNYFLLRDLDNRLVIAQRTLASRQENTRIITARFEEGWTN